MRFKVPTTISNVECNVVRFWHAEAAGIRRMENQLVWPDLGLQFLSAIQLISLLPCGFAIDFSLVTYSIEFSNERDSIQFGLQILEDKWWDAGVD